MFRRGYLRLKRRTKALNCTVTETVEQLTLKSHTHRTKRGITWAIQSLYRMEHGKGDGNLLSAAVTLQAARTRATAVNFRGPNPTDPKTVFYPEMIDGLWKLRCSLGNHDYYLFADGDKVNLRPKLSMRPNDIDKYLFEVTGVSIDYKTLQLWRTNWFLQSDEDGNASMKKVTELKEGKSQDRRTWFYVQEWEETEVDVSTSIILPQ